MAHISKSQNYAMMACRLILNESNVDGKIIRIPKEAILEYAGLKDAE